MYGALSVQLRTGEANKAIPGRETTNDVFETEGAILQGISAPRHGALHRARPRREQHIPCGLETPVRAPHPHLLLWDLLPYTPCYTDSILRSQEFRPGHHVLVPQKR